MNRRIVGMVGLAVLVCAGIVYAETEAINPTRVATRQVNVYGTAPLQIHSTNVTVTAAQLNAAGGGSTAALTPATVVASGAITTLGRAVVTSMGTTRKVADATIAAYSALATTITNTFAASYTGTPTGFIITDAYTGVCTNVITWASNQVTAVMGATGITYSVFSIGPKSN